MPVTTGPEKTPYWHLAVDAGCRAWAVLSNRYHPLCFVTPEEGGLLREYQRMMAGCALWSEGPDRQIAISGPDAEHFVNSLVTRDLSGRIPVGKARYAVVCDYTGGIVNDPVVLRIADDEIWLSGHQELLHFARGMQAVAQFDVTIGEQDVVPLQIHGPRAREFLSSLVADGLLDAQALALTPFTLCRLRLFDLPAIVVCMPLLGEIGYEVLPFDASQTGEFFWRRLVSLGAPHGLSVTGPAYMRRLEAGIRHYGADINLRVNPFEAGLDWQVDLDKRAFAGMNALQQASLKGVSRRLVPIQFGGPPVTWFITDQWRTLQPGSERESGYVTSACYSPVLDCNVGFAMLPSSSSAPGTRLVLDRPDHGATAAAVVRRPFVAGAAERC